MRVELTICFCTSPQCRSAHGALVNREELDRIKDLIEELRDMRKGTEPELYRNYSGAISNLRHILRMHGTESEPY